MILSQNQRKNLKSYIKRKREKRNTIKGVDTPKGNAVIYYRDLLLIVRELEEFTKEKILPILEQNEREYFADDYRFDLSSKLDELVLQFRGLDQYAKKISTDMVKRGNEFNRRSFVRTINSAVGIDISKILIEENIGPIMINSVAENVDLIKTIPVEYHTKIRNSILQGVASGNDYHSIREDLLSIGKSTKKRAKLIARDQVSKLNGNLNQVRQQDIGITGYTWRTSEDERVRESHADNDGKHFEWSNPPSTGHPGYDVNCRCTADPDMSRLLEMVA